MANGQGDGLDVSSFAAAYQELARAVSRAAPHVDVFAEMLRAHLGVDTTELPMVTMAVDVFDQPNLQRAVDELAGSADVATERVVGVRGQQRMFQNLNLAMLTLQGIDVEVGPVDYIERPVDVGRTLTCIDFALLLLRIDGEPFAILIRGADPRMNATTVAVDVMSSMRERSSGLLGRLRSLMTEHNVFRGKVVSLEPAGMMGNTLVARFLPRPDLARDDVILPPGVLERVERLTVEFSNRAASLRAGNRHLRRGLLMHGAPGTGKTHTVRYLLSRLPGHTVFVLAGQGLGAIGKTVAIARSLQPSIVVLEDVDLIAEERTRMHAGANPALFELLNQMDGVEEDADIVFLLTTNRPDLLEPALASRPGRVDLAVEVPLPAAAERLRLLQLYARGLGAEGIDWQPLVDRTEGSSAAFLRELLRQAALDVSGEDGSPPRLTESALAGTLADLAHASQAMTARLLGAAE